MQKTGLGHKRQMETFPFNGTFEDIICHCPAPEDIPLWGGGSARRPLMPLMVYAMHTGPSWRAIASGRSWRPSRRHCALGAGTAGVTLPVRSPHTWLWRFIHKAFRRRNCFLKATLQSDLREPRGRLFP